MKPIERRLRSLEHWQDNGPFADMSDDELHVEYRSTLAQLLDQLRIEGVTPPPLFDDWSIELQAVWLNRARDSDGANIH